MAANDKSTVIEITGGGPCIGGLPPPLKCEPAGVRPACHAVAHVNIAATLSSSVSGMMPIQASFSTPVQHARAMVHDGLIISQLHVVGA